MLQYLIIQLDDTSTSYCHYTNDKKESRLISVENLKKGILFAMKENLMIQFIYPDFELPREYFEIIESIDHSIVISSKNKYISNADVIVFNDYNDLTNTCKIKDNIDIPLVLRIIKDDLFNEGINILSIIHKIKRLNIVITDIESFNTDDFENYKLLLNQVSNKLKSCFINGLNPQLNILTDRIMLDEMNNCNAGYENITLAPNGKFYICPAFYYDDEHYDCGDLINGLNIKNKQLLKINYAPICRRCDAYHCKRCVYLNYKMTGDINTPSHEQCVISHLERNASRDLLEDISRSSKFTNNKKITKIDYLDPFDIITEKH